MKTRNELVHSGHALIELFCSINGLAFPEIRFVHKSDWPFPICAYYRNLDPEMTPTGGPYIALCVEKCANIGTAGMQWSYPGYTADRTPYGVLAHEIGHHCDVTRGGVTHRTYYSAFSQAVRKESGEARLTSYCPNDAEWFAEMMRLFITNPRLLGALRPKTCRILRAHFEPVEFRDIYQIMGDAPARTLAMMAKHINAEMGA